MIDSLLDPDDDYDRDYDDDINSIEDDDPSDYEDDFDPDNYDYGDWNYPHDPEKGFPV